MLSKIYFQHYNRDIVHVRLIQLCKSNLSIHKNIHGQLKFNFTSQISRAQPVSPLIWRWSCGVPSLFTINISSNMSVRGFGPWRKFTFLMNKFLDARIEHLPFTTTPWTLIAVLGAYLYFVNDFGRKWMANRTAFELKTVINIYNLIQIVVNFYLVVIVSRATDAFVVN